MKITSRFGVYSPSGTLIDTGGTKTQAWERSIRALTHTTGMIASYTKDFYRRRGYKCVSVFVTPKD